MTEPNVEGHVHRKDDIGLRAEFNSVSTILRQCFIETIEDARCKEGRMDSNSRNLGGS